MKRMFVRCVIKGKRETGLVENGIISAVEASKTFSMSEAVTLETCDTRSPTVAPTWETRRSAEST